MSARTTPSGRGDGSLFASVEGNAVGCLTCPKCDGQGFVAKPPWVAGDQHSWPSTDTSSYACPVCNGAKVIAWITGYVK